MANLIFLSILVDRACILCRLTFGEKNLAVLFENCLDVNHLNVVPISAAALCFCTAFNGLHMLWFGSLSKRNRVFFCELKGF